MRRRFSSSVMPPMTNMAANRAAPGLRIASGSGIRVKDAGGNEYIEAMSGLWCCGLGWGNEELVAASAEQMKTLSFYHGFTGRQTDASEALADALMAKAPARLQGGKVFFGQSGSDANDTQVRLLWLKAHLEGREGKKKFISRNRGYHGVTVASGSLTGLPYVHKSAGLPLDSVLSTHVTCPSFYREGRAGETEAAFVDRLAAELDRAIVEAGPDSVAAFIAEPMQGAGGVVVPPPGYHEATRRICDKYDVAIVGDEVITGFGRTGAFWGCEKFGQEPDMMSAAKMITMGYLPLSATLVPPKLADLIEQNTALFGHGYTYSGHPVACALALKVLEILDRDALVERVAGVLGPHFEKRLAGLSGHSLVGEARGAGLIGGVELVADKETKRPFDASQGVGAKVVAHALKRGLIVRALAGDVVALCPPLISTLSDIDDIFGRLGEALDATANDLAAARAKS